MPLHRKRRVRNVPTRQREVQERNYNSKTKLVGSELDQFTNCGPLGVPAGAAVAKLADAVRNSYC